MVSAAAAPRGTIAVAMKQGSPDWLEWRRGGYGASDAPVLVLGDEQDWRELHAIKLGILPDPEATEAMAWGVALESVVAKRYEEETGERVERRRTLVQHPELPMVRASLDRRRRRGRVIVEIKVYGFRTDEFGPDGSDQIPERMWYQLQQQLAASGWERADLAVYFGVSNTTRLGIFQVGRDQETIDDLLGLEQENWPFVVRRQMPPWPGPAPARVLLRADETEPTPEVIGLVDAIAAIEPQIAAIEKQHEAMRQLVRDALVDVGGTRGQLPDGRRFSVAYRPNRASDVTPWKHVAAGYRKRLLELGVPEPELDLPISALTVVKPGIRPLRITVQEEKSRVA